MKSKVLKIVSVLIVILCFGYIGKSLANIEIEWLMLFTNPVVIVVTFIGALILSGFLYIVARAWTSVLNFVEKNDVADSVFNGVYIRSSIAKYLPGNVMNLVGRNVLATKYDIKQSSIATATFIEIVLFAGTTVILAFLFMFYRILEIINTVQEYINYTFITGVILVGIVAVIVVILIAMKKNILKEQLYKYMNIEFVKLAVKVFLSYASYFIIAGCVLVCALIAVSGTQPTLIECIEIIGYYLVAYFLGYITPGAPGGIGIRETILILLLGFMVSPEIATIVTLMHRVITILSDVCIYLIVVGREKMIANE